MSEEQKNVTDYKTRVQQKVWDQLNSADRKLTNPTNDKEYLEKLFNNALAQELIVLSTNERNHLFEVILGDLYGLGPLEALLQDPDVSEIMVNRYDQIYIERKGKLEETSARFESEDHLLQIIDRIVTPMGQVVNESFPLVDVRLPDGSRVNIVRRPIAVNGTAMTIRKFSKKPMTIEQLTGYGSLTAEMAEFIRACVVARLNIVISGGTGSGKTTVFNTLANFIPNEERIITVELASELQLPGKHVISLEARPANIEGKGEVTIQDLVINAMKMRPERIIVGEVHGGEVLHVVQAMNTGHDGAMFTLHANSPRDALSRLEIMATMAGLDLPLMMLREQMGEAFDLIIQQQRLLDGSRRIIAITEVLGTRSSEIMLQNLFEFVQTGIEDGKVVGHFTATGNIPQFLDRIEAEGIRLPDNIFVPYGQ